MESSMCYKQIKELKSELHQTNIYLKDIAQSLKAIANPELRAYMPYYNIDYTPTSNNTREELSDDDLK